MKRCIDLPPFDEYADPRVMAELAYEAEQAGWDGVFTWDHLWLGMRGPFVDPWVALCAIASRTERVRIGAMVTPLARRRPWQLARTTASLDYLSNGRLIFGAGLGSPADVEFGAFGEETDDVARGRMLDEGLEALAGLWSGEAYSHQGTRYRIDDVTFQPAPLQQPRIPVWVGGQWPNKRPFRRAARWDGVLPIIDDGRTPVKADDLRQIVRYVTRHRTTEDAFDVVVGVGSPLDDPVKLQEDVAALEAEGLTWAMYGCGPWAGTLAEHRARLRLGPPD